MGECVRLRRSVFARARFTGFLEFVSLVGVMVVGLLVNDALHGVHQDWGGWTGGLVFATFWGACFLIRVAVWFEYVEADATSMRWRSLFREDTVPVERIVQIDVVRMHLSFERGGSDVLRVHHENGRTRKIRASAWCGSAREEWMRSVVDLWARTAPLR